MRVVIVEKTADVSYIGVYLPTFHHVVRARPGLFIFGDNHLQSRP